MVLWFISWIGRASQFVSGKKKKTIYDSDICICICIYVMYIYNVYIYMYIMHVLCIYVFI